MNNSIYILRCPKTNFVKYVGMSNNIKRRMYEHKSNKCNDLKYDWIVSLKNNGLKPKVEILENNLERSVASKKEIMYIKLFKDLGCSLLNISNGGDNPPSRFGKIATDKTKEKMFLNSPLKKVVYQFTKEGVLFSFYKSVREAGRQTNIDHRSISEVANGSNPKRHTAGGFIWSYKNTLN